VSRAVDVTLAVLLVIVTGLPLAYALFGRLLLAVVLAPLVAALTASGATMAMLVFGGSLRWWLPIAFLIQAAISLVLLRKRGRPAPLPSTKSADVLWIALPVLPLAGLVLTSPGRQWDSVMIWWLHGAAFARGADFARGLFSSPDFFFSHFDYPPAMSATVGGVLTFVPGFDLYVAQFVSSAVTLSAVCAVALAVRLATQNVSPTVSRIAALGAITPVWMYNPFGVSGGYSDALWACSFVGGLLIVLLGGNWTARPALPLILLSVAALGKNEGFIAIVILALVVSIKQRRELRRAAMIWIPVAAGLCWSIMARTLGAESDFLAPGFAERLPAIPVMNRMRQIASEMWDVGAAVWIPAFAVAVVCGFVLRERRRAFTIGTDAWLWIVFAGYLAALTGTYLTTANDLTWHLATSLDRVVLPLLLLATASVVIWAAIAVAALPRTSPAVEVPAQASKSARSKPSTDGDTPMESPELAAQDTRALR
jgi:hypothetical protein